MKRLALAAMLGCGAMASVDASAADVRLGVVGGVNVASVRIDEAPADLHLSSRTGLALGGVASWRLGERWSLDLRPSYVDRGTHTEVEAADTEVQASFVELPVLVTRTLGDSKARPYLLAGVALGHMTSAKATSALGEEDVTDNFAHTDVSLRLGAGLRFTASKSEPFVEVEYAWGLSDLNPDASGLGAGLGAIRNRGLQIRAGISFGLGGD